jgi:hypothetical protein
LRPFRRGCPALIKNQRNSIADEYARLSFCVAQQIGGVIAKYRREGGAAGRRVAQAMETMLKQIWRGTPNLDYL